MKRLSLLPALLAVFLLLPLGPVRAENDNWSDLLKAFKSSFKTKMPLKKRRAAVKKLAKSKDGRATKELLKVIKAQEKHAGKLRKEWGREEEAWNEKTNKLEESRTKKIQRAQERGEDSITLSEEEAEWFGSTTREGKMMPEKNRIQGLYRQVLDEEGFSPYIFKQVACLLNDLEGPERTKALTDVASAAKRAKDDHKAYFIHMLAYVRGEEATDILADFLRETSPKVVVLALEAIGRQNQKKGIKLLTDRLADQRWQIRSAALKGLSYYKRPDVMDILLAAAEKEEGVLRRKYFAAMARIVQEQVPGTIEAWKSFWKENREDYIERWKRLPQGEPVEGDPPDMPIDTSLGSTSFYGIRTNSKHIIFIVDISGSMGEQGGTNEAGDMRIDVARKELTGAIKSITASDEDERGAATFNIVLFSTAVEVYKDGKMVKATKPAKEKAYKWIEEKVQATDQTNIYDAIEQAFNIISDKKEGKNLDKGADTIFLITDGGPTRGKFIDTELILIEVKRMNQVRKITLHTIGVGEGHNAPFLRRLAAQNDGQYLAR